VKIRVYFIKNYIIQILVLVVMYGAIGYGCVLTKQYFGVFIVSILGFILLNRRIILYQYKIKIIQNYKKIEIRFDTIESLKIADYKPKFSKANIPAIYVSMKDGITKIVYHSSYQKESIIEIINFIIKKNKNIYLDSNVEAIINNRESKYEQKRKMDERQTIMLMIVAVIITIIYAKFGR
jgi:hypothetical protein